MEQKRILELAYRGAVDIWNKEDERAAELNYDNCYVNAREKKAWEELKEIAKMLKEIGVEPV